MKLQLLIYSTLFFIFSASAQDGSVPFQVIHPEVTTVRLLGVTKPLRDSQYNPPAIPKPEKEIENARKFNPITNPGALPHGSDPALQPVFHSASIQTIDTLFTKDGPSANVYPPDPNCEIGTNDFLQILNASSGSQYNIYSKTGVITHTGNTNSLWTQVGTSGGGDPIVMFDQQADRWLLTEFDNSADAVLVAVSQTSDPAGAYYIYEFQTLNFPDYPKYFIWNNAYCFTTNEQTSASPVYALNRSALLAGAVVSTAQRFTVPYFSAIGFQLASGADWDGMLAPPAGSPAYVLRIYDDAWNGGTDHIELWSLTLDFAIPANSSISGPVNLNVNPFDSEICSGGYCIDQPGSSSLDALQEILMHRVQYRNFGSYESMVLNHVVDVTGTGAKAGVRWYELRKTGAGPWTVYQQSTYSPDNNSRWMASIAQDGAGNIALGYSISGTSTYPSLRITARNASDPLNTMTYPEVQIATGVSTYTGGRWGDYSMMTVDPVDERTFWFTGEYSKASNYGTRIAKFKLRRDTNDVSVSQLLSPVSSGGLTNAEVVSVHVTNPGLISQSNFPVSYSVNGGPVVTETMTFSLMPDSSAIFTFNATADLSTLNGNYNIKIYTGLSTDVNHLNDTLSAQVIHLASFDAHAIAFTNTSAQGCGTTRQIGAIIKNEGATALTSLNLQLTINGSGTMNNAWTGNLITGQSDTVIFLLTGLVNGVNNITLITSMPNGNGDQNTSNDTVSGSFTQINPGRMVTVELKTDDYPDETSWRITTVGGATLYQRNVFDNGQTVYRDDVCLQDTCYVFRLLDSYGDGFDSGPDGYVKVFRDDSVILVRNTTASFGSLEVHNFCVNMICAITGNASVVDASVSGANDGSIMVTANSGIPPYKYSFNGGAFSTVATFNNLLPGNYTIIVRDYNQCADTLSVTVGVINGINEFTAGVVINVSPNPVDEVFKLNISGLKSDRIYFDILDVTGRLVQQGHISRYNEVLTGSIRFNDKKAGTYFIRLRDTSYNRLIRFIKD
jgi:hypothetical protein